MLPRPSKKALRPFVLSLIVVLSFASNAVSRAASRSSSPGADQTAKPSVPGVTASLPSRGELDQVRLDFRAGRKEEGYEKLRGILKREPDNADALYLAGEYSLLAGAPQVLRIIERLRTAGRTFQADTLDLKVDLFLGDERLAERLARAREAYPDSEEIRYIDWRRRLDEGDLEWATGHLPDADRIVFGSMPYEALFWEYKSRDPEKALTWAAKAGERGSAVLDKIAERLRKTPRRSLRQPVGQTRVEFPLVPCGPYFGIQMEDVAGRKITVTLDTGTSDNEIMIHDLKAGESLAGEKLGCFEKAVWYHYMPAPADLFYKSVSFRTPRLDDLLVGYFKGSITGADGVFSPFVFAGMALTVDPAAKTVVLRNKTELERYLAGRSGAIRLPYRERNGWIYVKAELMGRRALFMVETGSRDLNLNGLAAARYGVKTRTDTITWNGRDSKVVRPDGLTVDFGGFAYSPADGFVDDFVIGNYWNGCGNAGDIGPDFLRGHRFTIDPFGKALILEPLTAGSVPREATAASR